MAGSSFVHLHVHTEHSILDGAAMVAPLVAEAARLGMPAVGMTDHGNMFGAYEFHQQAAKAGVKPVIGIEAYVAPESRHLSRVERLALNVIRLLKAMEQAGPVPSAGLRSPDMHAVPHGTTVIQLRIPAYFR